MVWQEFATEGRINRSNHIKFTMMVFFDLNLHLINCIIIILILVFSYLNKFFCLINCLHCPQTILIDLPETDSLETRASAFNAEPVHR